MPDVRARRVADFSHCEKPGDFFLTTQDFPDPEATRRLSFLCPCGCGDLCGITVRNDGQQTTGAWGWDKNEDCPTTTPSIDVKAANGSHWHGYLTNGIFKSCMILVALLLLALPLQAQQSIGTLEIRYASMLVTKNGVGNWTASKNDNPGSIVWANGTTTNFPHVGIPATPVRGILSRAVDPCVASGIGDDGCRLVLNLPREPVRLMMGHPTAIMIVATGTLTWPDGKKFAVVCTYPASATTRINRKTRIAAGVIAIGEVFSTTAKGK